MKRRHRRVPLLIVVLVLVGASCGDDGSRSLFTSSTTPASTGTSEAPATSEAPTTSAATSTSSAAGARYSEFVRDSYLEGCMGEQNRGFCECTLGELEQMFTEDEFIRFAIETTEEMPPEALDVAFACIDQAGAGSTTVTAAPTTTTIAPVTTLGALPPGIPYTDFELITDDTGVLEASIPVEWTDRLGVAWDFQGTGDLIGPALSAAPDIQAWLEGWSTPGMFLAATAQLDLTPEEMLDMQDFSGQCTFDARDEYDDGEYLGQFDSWVDCGGVGSEFLVVAAEPYEGGALLLVEIIVVTEADLDAVSQVLGTFRLTGPLAG